VLQAHLAPAFYFLALWQLQLGPMELALENCVSDARENVHHPAPLSAIATLHAHEGRTAEALAIVKQMIEKARYILPWEMRKRRSNTSVAALIFD
jgi:hypothetical protein